MKLATYIEAKDIFDLGFRSYTYNAIFYWNDGKRREEQTLTFVVINKNTNRNDKYLLTCVSFIVAAVCEYGLVLALQEIHK